MLTTLLSIVLSLLAAPQSTQAAVSPSGTAEIEAFVKALDSCTPATAATPHPLMRSFTVQHTIAGAKERGCDYTQTMPGNMRMACMLSDASRKTLAAEIAVYAKGGTISGGTSSAQPTWMAECELVTADGKRQPMVQTARPRN